MKETIAAIATGMSNSGIGIVRMSGPEAVSIADSVFEPKKGKRLSESGSHTIHYGNIVYEGHVVDEVLVMLMKAPNTYTREDVIEIDCHGGIYVMRRIFDILIKSGARPAEPGEFTKRAFLNGRIDLSQAEAVTDIINSKNQYALQNSIKELDGKLSEIISEIRTEILEKTAYLEAALDDPEHISLDNFGDKLKETVDKAANSVEKLLKTFDNGKLCTQGINTVIIGKPNAGKSSILNRLTGYDRAIVTDIAGTTRDTIEEQININGFTLNLIDTAGIRKTNDKIEEIGVDKAKKLALSADLVLYVVDSSIMLDENDYEILNTIDSKRTIVILNKTDLITVTDSSQISKLTDSKIIEVSAKDGTGLDYLSDYITELFFNGDINYNDEIYISNERHRAALQNAYESLNLVKKAINDGVPEDLYTVDLMNAYEELGKITGQSVEEDLVNEIFGKFCMGK